MSKKPAAKQVSIAAFFSPQAAKNAAPASPVRPRAAQQTPAEDKPSSVFKTPSPAKETVGKRKRQPPRKDGAKPRAKKKLLASTGEEEEEKKEEEEEEESVVDLTASSAEKKRAKPVKKKAEKKPPAKRKAAAAPKAKAKAKGKAVEVVRYGVSPHERTGDDDDDLSDDEDAEEPKGVEERTEAEEKQAAIPEKEEAEEELIEMEPIATPEPPKPRKAPASAKAKKTTKAQAAVASLSSSTTPVSSPQKPSPVVAEPVDPVVRARIASYQQKIDELTRLCDRLSHSRASDDAVLQEIYGLGLDVELDVAEASDDERDAWQQLGESSASELPATLKRFVARATQSRSDSLTQLVARIAHTLGNDSNASSNQTLALEMEIKMLAQRTSYGARQAKANLYEDTTPEALWCWEVNNVDLYFEDDAQKTIKRLRKQRKRTGTQLKSLSRVVQLLHSTPTIDEAKVSQEEVKIGKFVSQVESELQKARDKEKKENEKVRKEQEKAQALEEKKRVEHEKLVAKEEEKRKKEIEAEAEKLLAEKRKKSLVSYFRSIDTVPEPGVTGGAASAGAAGVATTGAAAVLAVPVGAGGRLTLNGAAGEEQRAKMARMDQEVPFLVKEASVVEDLTPRSPSRSGASLFQRRRAIVTARVGHWSSRQHRDPKLGVVKMLQFHENYRPAYNGTFSKRSSVFRRGRRPFAQYAKFDYTVDSEEEWEEEEPGESLSGVDSDMDGEDDDDQLDYGDDWLAYEDEVEYVDGEQHDDEDVVMDDDADGDDEGASSQAVAASRKRRRKRVAAENKKQKLTKLVPEVRGPFVCSEESGCDHLASLAGELLEDVPEFVSPLMKRAEAREEAAAAAAMAAAQQQQLSPARDSSTPVVAAPAATTLVVKKKVKTPKKTSTSASSDQVAAAAAAATGAAPTTHKPPVKRKISPQLLTASSNGGNDAPAKPKAAKKTADATASQPAASVPKASPVKSGITGWLKTPASSSTPSTTDSTPASTSSAPTEASTSATTPPVKAPVEI